MTDKKEQESRDEWLAWIVEQHKMFHNYLPVTVRREEGKTIYEGTPLRSNLYNDYSNIERLVEHYLLFQGELKEGGAPSCVCCEYAAKLQSDKIAGWPSSSWVEKRLRGLL